MRPRATVLLGLCAAVACAPLPEAGVRPGSTVEDAPTGEPLVPLGYGTLRQEEIAFDFSEGPLRIQVTPLAEGVLRLLVPDAYGRLVGLRELAGPTGGGTPFLVSFFTEQIGVRFEQSDLVIAESGRMLRPDRVIGVTQGWGTGLLRQREPQTAVYLYPTVDLERDFRIEYRTARSDGWAERLPLLQSERGRIRGRAGGGGEAAPAGAADVGDRSSSDGRGG